MLAPLLQGLLAPVLASCSLFGLYLLVKYVPDFSLQTFLDAYFWLLGSAAIYGAGEMQIRGYIYNVTHITAVRGTAIWPVSCNKPPTYAAGSCLTSSALSAAALASTASAQLNSTAAVLVLLALPAAVCPKLGH